MALHHRRQEVRLLQDGLVDSKLVVAGNVKAYDCDKCALAFLREETSSPLTLPAARICSLLFRQNQRQRTWHLEPGREVADEGYCSFGDSETADGERSMLNLSVDVLDSIDSAASLESTVEYHTEHFKVGREDETGSGYKKHESAGRAVNGSA